MGAEVVPVVGAQLPPVFAGLNMSPYIIKGQTVSTSSYDTVEQMFRFGNTYVESGPTINGRM